MAILHHISIPHILSLRLSYLRYPQPQLAMAVLLSVVIDVTSAEIGRNHLVFAHETIIMRPDALGPASRKADRMKALAAFSTA